MLGKKVGIVGPYKLTMQIIKNEGTVGLFRGLVPTLVREMPGYFVFFGGYEGTREWLTNPGEKKEDIGLFKTMLAGAVGGLSFWAFTYPADVAKSRIQVSNLEDNMVTTLMKISRTEGIGALYNGLAPTLVRTVPATATLFVTYEYSKKVAALFLQGCLT
ncbi:hypothetical protein NQ317_012487 [Molorchus minor]|uniref:Uncharacterized protein n=1 Tax=Molorchus minor TaxID=1323400 RepID=A0ABQ9K258_9CUCU|nr:hypothetical protein NQ317_012487 [Molorchus minor]